jgi:predicted nucleotidyltransferase
MLEEAVSAAVPARLIAQVVERLQPEQIWLFGSRATGGVRPDSDYDLLVVVPDDAPADRVSLSAAYASRRGTGVAADIVPCRRQQFEDAKNRIGTLSYTAFHRGQKIYERGRR